MQENDLGRHIRFGHTVIDAGWSPDRGRWTVRVARGDGETITLTCHWLFSAAGYYDYAGGYTPHFEGQESFRGPIVHPQQWPDDLDYTGKRVVVIGSGATAVTLIPGAMAGRAKHVTMLQRSPSYVMTLPAQDPIANALRRLLPIKLAYRITRRMNIARQRLVYSLSMRHPQVVRRLIRAMTKRQLPEGFAVCADFNPRYNPWEEAGCAPCRTATCSRRSAPAGRRWSPTGSRASPSTGSCSSPASSSARTSSSAPRV